MAKYVKTSSVPWNVGYLTKEREYRIVAQDGNTATILDDDGKPTDIRLEGMCLHTNAFNAWEVLDV